MGTQHKLLRVWHVPQIPGVPFEVEVYTPEQAKWVMGILARYDNFQYRHFIKPDYSSAQGLTEYDDERGEMLDWHDEDGNGIGDFDLRITPDGQMTLNKPTDINGEVREWIIKEMVKGTDYVGYGRPQSRTDAELWLKIKNRAWGEQYEFEIVHVSAVPQDEEEEYGDCSI